MQGLLAYEDPAQGDFFRRGFHHFTLLIKETIQMSNDGHEPDTIIVTVDTAGNFTYSPSTKVLTTQTYQGHQHTNKVKWEAKDNLRFVVHFPNSPFQQTSFRRNQIAILRNGVAPGVYKYAVAVMNQNGALDESDIFLDNCPEICVEC